MNSICKPIVHSHIYGEVLEASLELEIPYKKCVSAFQYQPIFKNSKLWNKKENQYQLPLLPQAVTEPFSARIIPAVRSSVKWQKWPSPMLEALSTQQVVIRTRQVHTHQRAACSRGAQAGSMPLSTPQNNSRGEESVEHGALSIMSGARFISGTERREAAG